MIRPATLDDAAEICRIYNLHVALGGATFDTVNWTAAEASPWLDRCLPDRWFVASNPVPPSAPRSGEPQERIHGWASVRRFSDRNGFRHSVETAIYLAPSSQGQGVGDALYRRVATHCRENRIHHAVAKIMSTNLRSIEFHRRHGYRVVGVQSEIGWIEDSWVDLTVMQRLFPADEAARGAATCPG